MFKIGDVVQLKSGSPYMTVIEVGNNGYLRTIWFFDGKFHFNDFLSETLMD